jgi:caffeoyl-CoA O-methyltransferase
MSPPVKSYACTNPLLAEYVYACFQPEDEHKQEIRDRAVREKLPNIHVGAMDGLHLEVLIRATGAKKVVEIGSLAGYSGLCIARALPEDGHLYTFEFYEKNASICQETFTRNNLADKVTVLQGPALENLSKIEHLAPFDAIFVDADKSNYPEYLAWAEKHLRIGGTLLADNTFAWGLVLQKTFDTESQRHDAAGVDALNRRVANNPNWRATLWPTGEGLTMAVRLA